MRGFSLIAVTALLSSCGDQTSSSEPNAHAEVGDQSSGDANLVGNAPHQPAATDTNAATSEGSSPVSPCLMQGNDRLQVQPFRAIGTEPFWAARVEGRCVTYSTPEDQKGVRVWTRYSAGTNGAGNWVGQLGGKPFEMRTRPEAGCSDGMSDKVYSIAVELTVNGEQRRGCAEPL